MKGPNSWLYYQTDITNTLEELAASKISGKHMLPVSISLDDA